MSTPAFLFPQGRQYFHAELPFREIQGASWIQSGRGWVTAETYKGTAVSVNVNCTLWSIHFYEHASSHRAVDHKTIARRNIA